MTRTYLLIAASLICNAALLAQTEPVFQLFEAGAGPGAAMPARPRTEPGKPFSATAVTQRNQILTDGTHVSNTTTVVEYRDAQGRVRTEETESGQPPQAPPLIWIVDPVAQARYQLVTKTKYAFRTAMVDPSLAVGASGGRGGRGGRGGSGALNLPTVDATFNPRRPIVEDLGTMMINGVQARGTRTTTVVPVGAIGNDREFHSIHESWYSPDLNLLVKTVNTDPRFATITYELTNISRQPPDPSLFQVPADYTVTVVSR
jgi:hypothetical protein